MNRTPTVLVVDDTPANVGVLLQLLSREGYKVLVAQDGESALLQLKHATPDIILLDVMMPGIDGYEVCRRLKQEPRTRDVPVLFMTALGELEERLRGFNVGASDYVTKPLQHEEVLARVKVHVGLHLAKEQLEQLNETLENRVAERTEEISKANVELSEALKEIEALKQRLQAENSYLKQEINEAADLGEIIGDSAALGDVLKQIGMVAPTDSTVLICGETGTGKELIARAIHAKSPRFERPMVKLNCAAISAGLVESELFGHVKGAFTGAHDKRVGRFELADGGTLFLDEVSELPLETQVKLLRVLQEGEFEAVGSSVTKRVDVRVIAASNRKLPAEMEAGRFRPDLYYRLSVFPIKAPPLRERVEDIPILARFFLKRFSRRFGKQITNISPDCLEMLLRHAWPGNIRDLRNVIERACIVCDGSILTSDALNLGNEVEGMSSSAGGPVPQAVPAADAPSLTLADVEREHIIAVLKRTKGVIEGPNGAALLLNMNPSTTRYRIKKLGITRDQYL